MGDIKAEYAVLDLSEPGKCKLGIVMTQEMAESFNKMSGKEIAKANDMTEDEVQAIIEKCTDGRFLGLFGEETVNVLKVNLMLDGILEE